MGDEVGAYMYACIHVHSEQVLGGGRGFIHVSMYTMSRYGDVGM